MERQQAVRPDDEDEDEPTEEQMAAAREAFPAPFEESAAAIPTEEPTTM